MNYDMQEAPENLKDYRITAKVRNNRILSLIESAGYPNVSQFCKAHGFSQTHIGRFVGLKRSPINKDGSWSAVAVRMAECLRVTPDMLFSEVQKTLALHRNVAEQAFSEEQVSQLKNDNPEALMLIQENVSRISNALTELNDREKAIIELRFGLNGHIEHTYRELASVFNVSFERIRQIEAGAIKKMRATA